MRAGISAARTGVSAAHAAFAADRPTAGALAPAPGDDSLATGIGSGDRGAGSHLSGRTCPYLLPPLPRLTTSTPLSRAGKPLLLAQPELLAPLLPSPRIPLSSALHPLLLSPLRRARVRARSGRGRVGPRGVHAHHLQGSGKALNHADDPKNQQNKKGKQEILSPIGRRGAWRTPTGTCYRNAPP
jgi:hypothetical protein